MERDAAQREFERATEALRKFEKDAVPILKSRGDLVSMAEVERALRSGLGRVAAALDGLVSRRPELADEVRVVKSHIVREPLLERCSA